jgi:hypothetical protein
MEKMKIVFFHFIHLFRFLIYNYGFKQNINQICKSSL